MSARCYQVIYFFCILFLKHYICDPLVRCLRARKERFAKPSYPKRVPRVRIPPSPQINLLEYQASRFNLKLSRQKRSIFTIFANLKSSGCSVARSSRLVWDQKVASSNLATPTYKILDS